VDIAAWLRELGLARYEQAFRENDIAPAVLPELTDRDLQDLGVSLGHRRLLLKAIRALADDGAERHHTEASRSPAARPASQSGAERRQLTVMFVDLVGSTALSARLDPEDMGQVIRAYQKCCAEVIRRWDGHVAKYLGDGVLAYSGWPQAHEDAAERAVRAGLAIIAALAELDTPAGAPLAVRVGIATGLVMVGDLVGDDEARERAVVGETPNLAARLQALATPGSVVISQATRRLIGGLFELADLGPKRLKGFAEPLAAWRVEGEGRAEGRFEALHGERLTPLVGREHEVGILLERWTSAKEGDGQAVLLSGEPGIGKSRVVRTLRERLGDEPYVPLSHYCSPHHTNSALYPLIGLLERAARLDREEPPEAQLAKLEAVLGRSSDRLDEAVPLLAALLGIPTGDRYPALNLTPEVLKRRTFQALLDQLAGLGAQQPVLALYEDVHWVDPSTLELLGLIIERIQRLPVLVLITFRPEFQPPWTGHAHVTSLAMSRLGRRQGVDLVARITGSKPLPSAIVEQIVGRTDGVPLFVEELTKTVLESGLLADVGDRYELSGPLPPLAIPTTLHDSLMARLDRLAPVKEVAQIAAVIGREFSHELLAAVTPLSEDKLGEALDQLVTSELVFRRGTPPDATYSFKHALVQDAAYQSLLRSRRQQLHARIAKALEAIPNAAETQPELLAHHFTEAALARPAVDYWLKAGELAIRRSATVEAIAQLRRGLDQVESLPGDLERASLELDLQTALGGALIAARGFASPETGKAYTRAGELCRQLGQPPQLFRVLYGQYVFHLVRAELD
jgi:class 3 adenylate cyclase